jgi:hypothetical protein
MKHAVQPQGDPSALPKEKMPLPEHNEWTPFTDKRSFDERIWDS